LVHSSICASVWLVNEADAKALLEAAKEERVLIGAGGLKGHVIRVGPSLLISDDEVAEGIARLERACARADSL
jgi:4-aminobutyrate aminotransferase-like enzyme